LLARAIAGGGLWSTLGDIVRFAQAFLGDGALDGSRVLAPPTVEVMTRNHTSGLMQEIDGVCAPFNYGYGWGKPGGSDDILCSPASFGHGGATGTLLWIDPHWGFAFAFLTNRWGADGDVPNRTLNAVYGSIGTEE
jgi:CubicO group peptidase (beta-lactamase class C family)